MLFTALCDTLILREKITKGFDRRAVFYLRDDRIDKSVTRTANDGTTPIPKASCRRSFFLKAVCAS